MNLNAYLLTPTDWSRDSYYTPIAWKKDKVVIIKLTDNGYAIVITPENKFLFIEVAQLEFIPPKTTLPLP